MNKIVQYFGLGLGEAIEEVLKQLVMTRKIRKTLVSLNMMKVVSLGLVTVICYFANGKSTT